MHLGEELWRQIVAAGLKPEGIVYWTRLQSAKVREINSGQPSSNVTGFLKFVSSKVSSAIDQSNVIDNRRVLVVTESGSLFVVGQIGLTQRVWSLQKNEFRTTVRMNGTELEIELNEIQPLREIQQLTVTLNFMADTLPPFGGRIENLLGEWLKSRDRDCDGELLPFPLFVRTSHSRPGSFFHPIASSFVSWVSVSDGNVRFFNDRIDRTIDFARIISWREIEQGLECLAWSEEGVSRLVITPHGAVSVPTDSEQPSIQSTGTPKPLEYKDHPEPNSTYTKTSIPSTHPGTESFQLLRAAFRSHASEAQSDQPVFAAELRASPVFEAQSTPVGMTIAGDVAQTWVGAESFRQRTNDAEFVCYDFPAGRFLQTNGAFFRVNLPSECESLWATLCKSTEHRISIGDPAVTLAMLEDEENNPPVPVKLMLDEVGQIYLRRADGDQQVVSSLQVSAGSLSWTTFYGQVQISDAATGATTKLTASPEAIIALWKGRERQALRMSTSGVKLGELYETFTRRRTEKFLAGIFGSLIVTHEQLQIDGTIRQFREELNAAPSGPLNDELSARLVQRLSILEISRQQLGRWFDRCSLYLPHFWASLERDWLERTFGDQFLDEKRRNREAWRVQQSVRGELRQVQASLGRPLQELGQNLNAVSFAFPEEVRCAALASVRNAAGMAEKGAILSAFGGMGAQLLMGMGRASLGDPIGVAILGTMGLSLFGKHLQKKAQDVEQRIRLRAYGCQALQWWEVIQESGMVMAFECRQSMEQLSQTNFERDRKLLERIPRDQLSVVQNRMVIAMREWLQQNLNSQFYEVVPGSGLFGHQLVQRIAASTDTQAGTLISEFGYELPGSLKKD